MSIAETPPEILPLLEIMPRKKWTDEECQRMVKAGILSASSRYELIQGDIVEKVGQNPPHVFVLMQVFRALLAIFGFDFLQTQAPIFINRSNKPEPDVSLLARPVRDYLQIGTPPASDVRLAVEVSDSTLPLDRTIKALTYAQAGIPEYWLIDVAGRQLIVHRQPTPNGYADQQTLSDTESLSALSAPNASIRIGDLLP